MRRPRGSVPCPEPGCPNLDCTVHKPNRQRRPSSHARGYTRDHQGLRRKVKRHVDAGGVRCARGASCFYAEDVGGVMVGGIIQPGQEWDLGHDDTDRSRYLGPEHRRCNRATKTHALERAST